MNRPKFKIIGTNQALKAFLWDCEYEGYEVSKANSFFRDDYEHCLIPPYAYDEKQPDNLKLQTLEASYPVDIVYDLASQQAEALFVVARLNVQQQASREAVCLAPSTGEELPREVAAMKPFDVNWFNLAPPFIRLFGVLIKPYNLFNRRQIDTTDGPCHMWGVGVLQVGKRHLFYLGNAGFYFLFFKIR